MPLIDCPAWARSWQTIAWVIAVVGIGILVILVSRG
jgi:hypothetical protein